MSPEELERLMAEGKPVTIIDVRTPEKYAAERLPGAVNIPLDDLEARLKELDPEARTLVY